VKGGEERDADGALGRWPPSGSAPVQSTSALREIGVPPSEMTIDLSISEGRPAATSASPPEN
jgi:hypothetical protein